MLEVNLIRRGWSVTHLGKVDLCQGETGTKRPFCMRAIESRVLKMEFVRQVSRMLHEEHMAALLLLERLESALHRTGRSEPPDMADSDVLRLMGDLQAGIQGEISNHFAFEEKELFPCLTRAGDGDMVDLLCEEHQVILPLGHRLAELAHSVRTGSLTSDDWRTFHRLGGEFVERLRSHIDKEEMGLISAVEGSIDEEEDMHLAEQYAYSR